MQRMGTYLQETISARGHLTYATDYARMALVAGALGYDARNVMGVDLIGELCKSDLVEKQGLNGYIYTLLALDSKDYSLPEDALWTADKLVEKICALQKEKGYFVFARQLWRGRRFNSGGSHCPCAAQRTRTGKNSSGKSDKLVGGSAAGYSGLCRYGCGKQHECGAGTDRAVRSGN